MPRFEKGSDEAKAYMKSIREARKLKTNYEKMKGHEDLIMTNTAEIAVPKTLLYIDGKGEHKIIKTLTKAGTLTRKDKKPVIKIEPKTDNELRVVNQGKTKKDRSTGFLREIHSNTKYVQAEKEAEMTREIEELSKSRTKKDRETKKQLEEQLEKIKEGHIHEYVTFERRGGNKSDKSQQERIKYDTEQHYAPRKIKKKETKT